MILTKLNIYPWIAPQTRTSPSVQKPSKKLKISAIWAPWLAAVAHTSKEDMVSLDPFFGSQKDYGVLQPYRSSSKLTSSKQHAFLFSFKELKHGLFQKKWSQRLTLSRQDNTIKITIMLGIKRLDRVSNQQVLLIQHLLWWGLLLFSQFKVSWSHPAHEEQWTSQNLCSLFAISW